jgi:hypothetical protein
MQLVVWSGIRWLNEAVTVSGKTENMCQISNPPRAALCVIRAERQGTGLLITLVVTEDVEDISDQRSLHVADIGDAVDAVRHFLIRFAGSSG